MPPPSVYEAAVMLQAPTQGPTNHYRMDEASGLAMVDYGVSALNLGVNGTVARGYDSGLPGDPVGRASGQSKDTVMATRGDVGTGAAWDRPGTTNKLTLMCWYRPDDVRPGGSTNEYVLISKGSNTYQLTVTSSALRTDLNGQSTQLASATNHLMRVGTWMHIAVVFDGAIPIWKMFVNGVLVGQRTPNPTTVNHAAGGTLQVGGYNAFGANGIHGRMQHVTIFNAHAIADAQIQNLYRVGVVRPGSEGDEAMYVFPWNREIVPTGGAYRTIDFVNSSAYPVSLSQGGTAAMGAGITLAPRGGRLPRPSTWNGAWSGILNARFGYTTLGIVKTY